jgi:hypothetical protein
MQKVSCILFTRRNIIGNQWNHKILKENQITFMDRIIDYHMIIIHLHLQINHLFRVIRISKRSIKKY